MNKKNIAIITIIVLLLVGVVIGIIVVNNNKKKEEEVKLDFEINYKDNSILHIPLRESKKELIQTIEVKNNTEETKKYEVKWNTISNGNNENAEYTIEITSNKAKKEEKKEAFPSGYLYNETIYEEIEIQPNEEQEIKITIRNVDGSELKGNLDAIISVDEKKQLQETA